MRRVIVRGLAAGLSFAAALSAHETLAADGPPVVVAPPAGSDLPRRAGAGSFDASAPVIVPGTGASAVVATEVAITLGSMRIVVPRIEARGTELTRERLATVLDPSSALAPAERLAALTAASLTASRVEILPRDGGGAPLVLTDVALTDVVKGRIGSLSIGQIAIAGNGTAASGSVTLGPVAGTALDGALALDLVRSHRSDAGELQRLLIGSLSSGSIAVRSADGSAVAVGGIALAGLRARAPLRPHAELLALVRKPAGTLTSADRQQLAEAAIDAAGSIALDHLAVERLAFAGATATERLEVGRMVFDDVGPARLGSWAVDDVALSADDTEVGFKHFALHGSDESVLLTYLARSLASGDRAVPPGPMPRLPPQDGSMALVDLRIVAPNAGTPGNSRDGTRTEIVIPVASASTATEPGGAVTATAQFAFDYALPKADVFPQADMLRAGGIDTLHAGLDGRVAFDQGARELRLGRFAISAEKLGSLATTLTLGNLPVSVPSVPGDGTSEAATRAITLREAGFTFDNAGIVDLVLPALAASTGTSLPLFKAGLKTEAELAIGRLLGASPTATRLVAAVAAFVDDPKAFTLKIEAPDGLTIGEIQDAPDPRALLDRLGIEATADR